MQTTLTASKPHYPILDGLRGVAAVLVVLFHIFEAHFWEDPAGNFLPHGYLAVDFFFLLSGFVVGYAYDDRWEKMSVWQFFKIRLVRLHPLVILGVLIGLIGFIFDPFTAGMQNVSILKLIASLLIGMTLLPSPDVRGWGETHSLDGPCWSLLQEYIANLLYALFGRQMIKSVLWVIVILSGSVLTYVSVDLGNIGTGWSYSTFWIGLTRMMFPFFAGLLLFRTGKIIRIPYAFLICSLMIIGLFALPFFKYNGLFESAAIILLFPLIISFGAGGEMKSTFAKKLCKFLGDISYPIYITHYVFIYIYTAWVGVEKPSFEAYLPVAVGMFVVMMLLAYFALKFYDEPVRAWLKKTVLKKG